MNFDDILKTINRLTAERFMREQERLFTQQQGPPRYGFSGFRNADNRLTFPDDGKTITLTKKDYKVIK